MPNARPDEIAAILDRLLPTQAPPKSDLGRDEDWKLYAERMEAELAELRRLNLPPQTGEQMEYILTRDQLAAIEAS